jgi:hypothetical protein
MSALPADIAAATRDALVITWSNAGVAARYPSARDASVAPATGYFDTAASAQALVDARGMLLGSERRRFTVGVQDLLWPDLFARVEIDLDAETTTLELFG